MNYAIDAIAKPAVLLLGAAVLSILLRRSSASVRHAVWLLALTGAAMMPLLSMTIPRLELPAPAEAEAIVTFLARQGDAGTSGVAGAMVEPAAAALKTASPAHSLWLQPASLWALGVMFMLLRLIIGTVAVRRLANARFLVADENWKTITRELAAIFRIRRPVQLVFSERQTSPMTWGVVSHKILLPKNAADWTAERRRLVLAHELAHVKRNDGLIQLLVHGVCCVYWFNPLVWYAAHRIRVERERACDDQVLNLGTGAADYAEHLLQVVRGLRARQASSFAAVSMAQPSQLESRLVSILDSRARRRALSTLSTAALCTLAGGVTISLAAIGVTAAVPLPPVVVTAMAFVPPTPVLLPAAKPAAVKPQQTRIGNAATVPNNAVHPPRVLESRPPTYTEGAAQNKIEGIVTLEAAVDVNGKVSVLRVVKDLGFGLVEKAKKAVMEWKFAPATRNGVPVDAVTQIDVAFTIPPWYDTPQDDMPPIPIGPGVTPPSPIFRVEPEYTEEARKERIQGAVALQATIHQDGRVTVKDIRQELGYGLTGKAIEALELWKFKPAMKDGKAVPVMVNIEVNFNLK